MKKSTLRRVIFSTATVILLGLVANAEEVSNSSFQSIQQLKERASLYVNVKPKNARVRILNIKPKFYNGIQLQKGKKYHIRIDKRGYSSIDKWILLDENKRLSFSLKLRKASSKLSITRALQYYKSGNSLSCKNPDTTYLQINKYTHPQLLTYQGIYVVTGKGVNFMSMVALHDCTLAR